MVFFVTGGGSLVPGIRRPHVASFRVFKKSSGKWYFSEFISQPGMGVSGRMGVGEHATDQLEVDTGFTVVDVQNFSNGVHVVLKDGDGNMEPRD